MIYRFTIARQAFSDSLSRPSRMEWLREIRPLCAQDRVRVVERNLKPDITINRCKIVFRPHLDAFLRHALKHFDVAVWTSSRPQNAIPMAHHSFLNLLDFAGVLEEARRYQVTVRQVILGPSEKGAELMKERLLEETEGKFKLKFIWTQSECDTEPRPVPKDSEGEELMQRSFTFIKPVRKKNLDKIFQTYPEYSALNTLIIDDSEDKVVDHFENHLKIKEFNVIDGEIDFTSDKQLFKLRKYLDLLITQDPIDLRSFLSKYHLEDF